MKPRIQYRKGRWYAVDGLYFGYGTSPARAYTDLCRQRAQAGNSVIPLMLYHPYGNRKPSMWQQLVERIKK